MYKSFFDLVEEAQADGNVDVKEVLELMKSFVEMRVQLKKVEMALVQLEHKDLAEKVDELENGLFDFFVELNEGFILPPKPSGWFKGKEKKLWEIHNTIKQNLQRWVDDYNNQK